MDHQKTLNAVYASKGDLTRGNLTRHLIRLSAPMVFGILAVVSFQLVDTFYLSLLGTPELAAISLTFPFSMALLSFFIGLSIAMSSVVARQIGEKNHDKVRRITTHGLIYALIAALAMTLLCFAFLDPILTAMGADEVTLPLARSYMDIWLWSNLLIAVPMTANAAMRAAGDSLSPAVVMNLSALINIILDPFLIFGIGPFPRLEMQGAALATLAGNVFSMVVVLYILHARKKMICRDGLHLNLFGDSAKRLSFIAIPAGVTGMITPVISGFILALLAASGAEAIAAFGVASRIEGFAFVLLMGLASGMAPILGQNWGAQNYERVDKTLSKALRFSVYWSLFIALALGLAAKPIAGLFSDNEDVIRITAFYFWIVPVSYIFGNLLNGWTSAFHALGLPIESLMVLLIKNIVLTIPLAWLGAYLYGYVGIFVALAFINVIMGISTHIWGRRLLVQKRAAQSAPQTSTTA